MKIGICVGHSRWGDSGAVSLWGKSEWDYNSAVAVALKRELDLAGIDSVILDDYKAGGYGAAMRNCAKYLLNEGATHAIELHFNAAGPQAHGAEWLHWRTSSGGKRLAEALRAGFTTYFPGIKDRGLKPKGSGERGALFLRKTHCPAVIAEPFFGSNEGDCEAFRRNEAKLAAAYAEGIRRLS